MRWYVTVSGNAVGPVEEHEVLAQIAAGGLRGAQICAEGASQWMPIESHAAFAAALAGTGAPAPVAVTPAPHSAAASPAPKKKSPLVLVGAGCGALLVVALCAGGGVALYRLLGEDDPLAEPVLQASRDVVSILEGGTADGWEMTQYTDEEDVAAARAGLEQLGDSRETVLVIARVAMVANGNRMTFDAFVFPDGRVRYGSFSSEAGSIDRFRSGGAGMGREDLGGAPRALLDRVYDAASCRDLPVLTAEDLEELPAGLQANEVPRDSTESDRDMACARFSGDGSPTDGWVKIARLGIMMRGNGQVAALSIEITVGLDHLWPSRVSMTPLRPE